MSRNKIAGQLAPFALLALLDVSPGYAQNLSEIIHLALQNDPVLKQASANQAATGELKDQSIARFFPVISVTGATSKEYLHNKKAGSDFRGLFVNQEFWSHTFSLNITQPLFHWDYWIQLSQSENQIAQAEAAYQAELQNLMIRTTESYFNVLSAQDNLEFVIAEKNAIARQLEQATQRFEVGIIAITDVNEAQAAYDQARASEIEARNILENAYEALKEIIGDQEVELDTLIDQLPLSQPEPASIAEWSHTAEVSNYTILAALNQAEAARKAIEIQRNGHLPQLDMVANYGASDVNSSFGFRGDTQSIGLQLNVPLFEGGAVNSRIRQARYQYEAAKDNLTATKRSINRQVKNAYRSVVANISQVEAFKAVVISAETALEAAEAGFEVGTRTMVEVLAEQRFLFRAKRDYLRARYDYLINSIKLKQLASNLTMSDIDRISRFLLAEQNPADQFAHNPKEEP
ncbi:MAG: TolC family outer membrane protein [Gammaproteobacteria bacterium]